MVAHSLRFNSSFYVEDIPFYREYLARFCVQELRYDVVGTCGNVSEACAIISRLRPDLVLLDVCLGNENAFDVVDWVNKAYPEVRCALMSAYCTSAMAVRVARAPICGFIDKNYAGMEQFSAALQCLANDGLYYSASYQATIKRMRTDHRAYDKLLTDRELSILPLIGHGMSDRDIAGHLRIALATVQTHRRNIMQKLCIDNAPQLIRFAIDQGLVQLTSKPPLNPKADLLQPSA